jgi:enoyl-CoA hydratase/carnithine racemase
MTWGIRSAAHWHGDGDRSLGVGEQQPAIDGEHAVDSGVAHLDLEGTALVAEAMGGREPLDDAGHLGAEAGILVDGEHGQLEDAIRGRDREREVGLAGVAVLADHLAGGAEEGEPIVGLEEQSLGEFVQIAQLPPIAARQIKECVLAGQDTSLHAGLMLEAKAIQLSFASFDQKEGMAAFIEKRKPGFEGR